MLKKKLLLPFKSDKNYKKYNSQCNNLLFLSKLVYK